MGAPQYATLMDGHFWFDAFKYGGLLTALLCGILGTVTHTHKKGRGNEKKLTGWGWLFLILTILGSLSAVGGQWASDREKKEAAEKLHALNDSILSQLKNQKEETQKLQTSNESILKELEEQKRLNEEQKRLDAQKDIDYREQLDRILATQNSSIQKQAQANVASKLSLLDPEPTDWLSNSNALAKKRNDFAKAEAERTAKLAEEASRKSLQVYENVLFSVELTKKRVLEIKNNTGEDIEIQPKTFPANLCAEPFECLIYFKKSKAIWNIHTRINPGDGNDGYPWLSIDFSDYHGNRSGGVNLVTKPLEDSFNISYEVHGSRLVDENGKLGNFQKVARKVIEQAIPSQFLLTAPPDPTVN